MKNCMQCLGCLIIDLKSGFRASKFSASGFRIQEEDCLFFVLSGDLSLAIEVVMPFNFFKQIMLTIVVYQILCKMCWIFWKTTFPFLFCIVDDFSYHVFYSQISWSNIMLVDLYFWYSYSLSVHKSYLKIFFKFHK